MKKKTDEEKTKDIIIAKLEKIRDELQLTENEYYSNILLSDEQEFSVTNSGEFSITDPDGNVIDEVVQYKMKMKKILVP